MVVHILPSNAKTLPGLFCNWNCIHFCSHIMTSSSNVNKVEWYGPMPAVWVFVGSALTISSGLPGWHCKAKFQKFAPFWSCLAWKNGVWRVRHSLAFFWPFLMNLMVLPLAWKNIVRHFLKPLAQLLLLAWNYKTFSQDKVPLFYSTVPFSKIQLTSGFAVYVTSQDKRHNTFLGMTSKTMAVFKQCRLGENQHKSLCKSD